MSALLGIFAAPAAGTIIDAAKGAVAAAARPFADVLGALADKSEPAAADGQLDDDERDERVAARLQEILEASGAASGDCSSVCYDEATGEIEVNDGAASGDAVRDAIEADEQLMDDLRQMAEVDPSDDGRLELLVQIA